MNHVFGELGIRFWVISSIQAFLLVRLTEVWRKSKQKEKKKEKEKVMKSQDSVLGFHMNTPETSSPSADLFMRDHLLCPFRCCSTSSSLST